jgi:3-dehydroquinate synthase
MPLPTIRKSVLAGAGMTGCYYNPLMPPTRVEVTADAGAYPIVIGAGIISTLPKLLDQAGLGPRRLIVSSPAVWDLHGSAIGKASSERSPILVQDGERFKNASTVGRLYESLIQCKADRGTVIVAVGGGVVGDLVGFAAATYLRGLRLVQIPTTVMAQVDSSIGGKVGINHLHGKNLIGAFHAPKLVVADPNVLTTLPRREFRAGLYEVVKYGVIASPTLFARLETSLPAIFAREADAVGAIVAESCRIKAEIVSADERESGLRRVLNFGHTMGHALEAVTRFRRFRHGEAVAYGMLAAMALGVQRSVTPVKTERRVAALIAQLGPLPPVVDLSAKEIVAAIAHDKKIVAGMLHFIAATDVGATTTLTDVTEKQLKAALKAIGVTKA